MANSINSFESPPSNKTQHKRTLDDVNHVDEDVIPTPAKKARIAFKNLHVTPPHSGVNTQTSPSSPHVESMVASAKKGLFQDQPMQLPAPLTFDKQPICPPTPMRGKAHVSRTPAHPICPPTPMRGKAISRSVSQKPSGNKNPVKSIDENSLPIQFQGKNYTLTKLQRVRAQDTMQNIYYMMNDGECHFVCKTLRVGFESKNVLKQYDELVGKGIPVVPIANRETAAQDKRIVQEYCKFFLSDALKIFSDKALSDSDKVYLTAYGKFLRMILDKDIKNLDVKPSDIDIGTGVLRAADFDDCSEDETLDRILQGIKLACNDNSQAAEIIADQLKGSKNELATQAIKCCADIKPWKPPFPFALETEPS